MRQPPRYQFRKDSNGLDLNQEAELHFNNYQAYNSSLRNWLVAFGFGGLAIFLTEEELAKQFKEICLFKPVIVCLLLGSASQVILALVNKYIAWCTYDSFSEIEEKHGRFYNFLCGLSPRIEIDWWFDAASILLFAAVTLLMFWTLVF